MASLNIGGLYSIIDGKVFESTFLTREMTKGKKTTTIVFNQQLFTDAVKDYLGKRLERGEELESDSPIFKNEQEGHFTGQTLSIVFRTMFGSVGLKKMSIYTGRRTFALRLNEHGVSIKNIQTLMGHASILTTSISIENNPIKFG